jgi:hypothetical protein
MNKTNDVADAVEVGTLIKPCPCCAGRGVLMLDPGTAQYGIRCTGCPLTFPEVYNGPESAIVAWGLRKGTVSSAGGKGTRGKCSWRKRRACRKNLRTARGRRKVKQLKVRLLVQIPWLHALRAYEQAESNEEKAAAWASLKAMESKVMSIPYLRPFWKLLHKYAP